MKLKVMLLNSSFVNNINLWNALDVPRDACLVPSQIHPAFSSSHIVPPLKVRLQVISLHANMASHPISNTEYKLFIQGTQSLAFYKNILINMHVLILKFIFFYK